MTTQLATRQKLIGATALGLVVLVFYMAATSGQKAAPTAPAAPAPVERKAEPAPPAAPKPHFVLQADGRYGYEAAVSDHEAGRGSTANPLLMLAYNGRQPNGAHQFMVLRDSDLRSVGPDLVETYEWKPGDQFVSEATYLRGKFRERRYIRAAPGSVIRAAIEDAERGLLERYRHRPTNRPDGFFVACTEAKGCGVDAGR